MQTLFQDIRFGCRMLLRNPGFTIAALLCLGLGIGATTAVFSVVNGVLLRPLPYKDSSRLVTVASMPPPGSSSGMRSVGHWLKNYLPWKEQLRSFEKMAVYRGTGGILADQEGSELLNGLIVSDGYFEILSQTPLLGRRFLPEEFESGNHAVIIIGYGLWQRRFASDKTLIGKTVILDGKPQTVVGIMPPDIRFLPRSDFGSGPKIDKRIEFWVPPEKDLRQLPQGESVWEILAKLKQGVDLKQAQAEMDAVAQAWIKEVNVPIVKGWRFQVDPLLSRMIGDFSPILLVLFGATGFVLLIASANLACLLLIRVMSRQHELMIRIALGAGRFRLLRQLLTEGCILALLGGGIGLVIAFWAKDILVAMAESYVPRLHQANLDPSVLGFAFGLSALTGLAIAAAATLRALRMNVGQSSREMGRSLTSTRSHQRLIRLIVISEISLALVLLTGAGLLIRSFATLMNVETGFKTKGILTMIVTPPSPKPGVQQPVFYPQLLERLKSLPGVEGAAIANGLPLSGQAGSVRPIVIQGRVVSPGSEDITSVWFHVISPDYFRLMGIPLIRGRSFSEIDTSATIVVNEKMASHFWPNEDAIGKRFEGIWPAHEIIGIVGDTKLKSLDVEALPEAYILCEDRYDWSVSLVLRTKTDPMNYVAAVRNEIKALDKHIVVSDVKTMSEAIGNSVAERRFVVILVSVFAAIGLILAIVGIYGVMANSVAQRTHDIGVRIAMGAQRRDIVWMVVGQGLVLIGIGVGIGLAGAFALTRLIASQLYGVKATDPWTFAGVTILLAGVALMACYIPARRATKIDPMEVLRWE